MTASPVLVVGAGPAGATAARTLAEAGVRVTLVDRAAFPRNKPCGGAISARALRRFPELTAALARIATHSLQRLYLEGPDGDAAEITSDEPAVVMIRRVEFDALLVSRAIEAGAELVPGVDVVQATDTGRAVVLTARDGRRFEAPIVIAADGVHSVVARRLGLNPGWPAGALALDMMEETPRTVLRDVDPHTLWVAYGYGADRAAGGDPVPEGYAYIFPKRDHVNIGVGYVLAYYRHAVRDAPYTVQRTFVDRLKARGIVEGESARRNFTPFMIPVGGPLRRPGSARVLLAGDAGGFVNAFTAEGIFYAMVTGDLAARAVLEENGRAGEALLRRYMRACDHEIGLELRESVIVQRYLFADGRRVSRLVRGAAAAPRVTGAILDYVIGRRSYRSARRRLMLAAPALAAELVWKRAKAIVEGAPRQ